VAERARQEQERMLVVKGDLTRMNKSSQLRRAHQYLELLDAAETAAASAQRRAQVNI
jgi:hypothetical protein